MAAYRAFSLYRGAVPSGATLVGFAYNGTGAVITESTDHAINAGFLNPSSTPVAGQRSDVWMSPDIDRRDKLWIMHNNGSAGGANNFQPLPAGVTAFYDSPLGGIGFWGSPVIEGDVNNAYINLCNWAYLQVVGTPGTFTTGTAGRSWVRDNGFWDNYGGAGTCNLNAAFVLSPPNNQG